MSKHLQPGEHILIKIPKLPPRSEMMEWEKMESGKQDSGKFLDALLARPLPPDVRP